MPIANYTGVRTFSATHGEQRARIGDNVTAWLTQNPRIEVVATEVRQSSDQSHHCFTIVCFYREAPR